MSSKLCVVCGIRPVTSGQVPCCTECQKTWKEVEDLIHKEWKKDEIRCPKCGYLVMAVDEGWTMRDNSIRIGCQHCHAIFGLDGYGLRIHKKGTEA